jgi:myo-inositol-1(or 4)-monophosphatase
MSVDIEAIKQIVLKAGELALIYYGRVSAMLKSDLSIVTEADAAVESYLKLALTGLAPSYGYIGEETKGRRLPDPGETHSWVVDALDGSRAFSVRLPLWTPAVCLLRGDRPIAGAAFNPLTRELFWAAEDTSAYCNDEPLRPHYETIAEPNTVVLGSTNLHRFYQVDFPGRVYCLGAPIYQLCLVAKGSAQALFFDPSINLWDLALPALLLEKVGARLVYASGRPVNIAELMDRRLVPEPIFAGGAAMVETLRRGVVFTGRRPADHHRESERAAT